MNKYAGQQKAAIRAGCSIRAARAYFSRHERLTEEEKEAVRPKCDADRNTISALRNLEMAMKENTYQGA